MVGLLTSFHNRCKGTEVFNTSVGASTKENIVNRLAQQLFTWFKSHIPQRLAKRCLGGLSHTFCGRNSLSDTHAHTGIGSVGNHRFDISSIVAYLLIKDSILIALECLPIGQRLLPLFTLGCIFTAFDVSKGGFIRSHHPTTGTHLNREVAEGETSLHRETAYGLAGILHKISRSTAGGHLRHHVEGYILGGHSFA